MNRVSFPFLTIAILLLPLLAGNFNRALAKGPLPLFRPHAFCTDTAQSKAYEAKLIFAESKNIKDARLQKKNFRIKKIVIDPGHGGHDPGCLGSLTYEKHIALGIGLRLAASLRAQYPELEVVMTRDADIFIPLHERAQIANQSNADLFLSIHCNYIPKRSDVTGSETYVLGPHKLEENLDVAMRENAAILLEDNYEENYDFDPNSPEGHIILSMYQNAYLEQSILFAEMIEKHMAQTAKRHSRGVKQAGFLVLRETAMPSVLIETGFLSNRLEEEFLLTAEGQNQIAQAIFVAFEEYKIELEGTEPLASLQPKQPATLASVPQTSSPPSNPAPNAYEMVEKASPAETKAPTPSYPAAAPTVAPAAAAPAPAQQTTTKTIQMPEIIQFRVQLAASPEPLNYTYKHWDAVGYLVQVVEEDGFFKYQARGFNSFEEASAAREQLRQKGFPDAFVVAYRNQMRISIQEALQSRK